MKIKALFLDIGGVFLTNGWDHNSRKLACKTFDLDFETIERLHGATFDPFERGLISLDEYLKRVWFTEKRAFTLATFKEFIFSQSQPFPEMIDLIIDLKTKYRLKTVVVSNEGREINDYRIKTFKLKNFIDFFISSCYVHLLKPDLSIYKLALDTAQVAPEEALYVDNIQLYVDVAKRLGISAICHSSYQTTRQSFEAFGLY